MIKFSRARHKMNSSKMQHNLMSACNTIYVACFDRSVKKKKNPESSSAASFDHGEYNMPLYK